MTKIDIFSGFLGAGKTTLIKKMIKEAYVGEKLVLIENEFGQIGIDGGFMKEAGIEVNALNSGCICCSLVGDFSRALKKVVEEFAPDRILIEPSGVGKLSDVRRAVEAAGLDDAVITAMCTVVDAKKCKLYMKNFGEFFDDQVEHASTVILSHTAGISEEKLANAITLLKEKNPSAVYVTTDWEALTGKQILAAIEDKHTLERFMSHVMEEHHHEHHHHGECGDPDCECHHHEHHHHGECDDPDCECHHHEHHHHDECDDPDCECHHHEHHHHGECDDPDCECHHHEHHPHDECDDPDCECHRHGHHHHGHGHHADDIFESFGEETARKFTAEELKAILQRFIEDSSFGTILRAKGIVEGLDGTWLHFDYVPGEIDIRTGTADVIGRLCVIGSALDKPAIRTLFGL